MSKYYKKEEDMPFGEIEKADGTVYYEKSVYASKEDAELACHKKNMFSILTKRMVKE
jgi:hypothetical protein